MDVTVRHAEPSDAEALHRLFGARSVMAGTLQLPFPKPGLWRERLQNPSDGLYQLVACVEGEVVGELTPPQPAREYATSAASAWPCGTIGRERASGRH